MPAHFYVSYRCRAALVALLLFFNWAAAAQTPTWQSVVAAGQSSAGTYTVNATAADAAGNIFIAGTGFGAISFGNVAFSSAGTAYAYVAKWSPASRSFLWATRVSSTSSCYGNALAVNGSDIYLGGDFAGTISSGSATLSASGSNDVFVAKFTDAGATSSFGWAQRAGGVGFDALSGLAATNNGVYIGGSFSGSAAGFGSINLAATNGGAFIAKLTDAGSAGSFAWAQGVGGANVYALAASGNNVYAAGYFGGTSTFGNTSVAATGFVDAFVAKLVDAGNAANFGWVQRAGGTGSNYTEVSALALSGTNVYVAGIFSGAAVTFGATALPNAGGLDLFVTKLTDAGNTAAFAWAKSVGGSDNERARALAVDGTNVYVVGSFQSPAVGFGATTLTNADRFTGSGDIFLTKLADAGSTASFALAQRAVGTQQDDAYAVTFNAGVAYVGGYVTPSASFGTQTVSSPFGMSTGYLAVHSEGPLAVASASPAEWLDVYPNPAHATVQVRLPALAGATEARLTVTNTLGQVVRAQRLRLPATAEEVSLLGLAPGVYRLEIQAGHQRAARMVAVE